LFFITILLIASSGTSLGCGFLLIILIFETTLIADGIALGLVAV
jgi:hypothetical protein